MQRSYIPILAVVGATLSLIVAAPQKEASAAAQLQAAINKETVEADLSAAIKQYGAIVAEYAKTDRAVTAMAMVHMADCYQKMGDAESRKILKQVVREYADQKEAVTLARARLGGSSTVRETGMVARQIWTDPMPSAEASIASDGRTLSAITSSLDVAIRDIASNQATALTFSTDPRSGFVEWPVLSQDLRQVAYAWYSPEDGNYQVRVASAEPGAKPRVLVRNPEFVYYFLKAWSRDDKSVLAIIHSGGNMSQLAWISVADGSVKTLKSMEWRSPGLANLSPDGRLIAYDVLARQDSPEREIRILAADGSSETVLVNASGNNAAPVWTRDGARVLFLSKRSGSYGLWSVAVRDGKADGPVELAKPDTGNIVPLGFTRSGSLLYGQAVGHQDVFAVEIDPANGAVRGNPVRVVDTYVGANRHPAWSPDGKSVAYISRRSGSIDNTAPGTLVIRSLETGQEKTIATTFTYGHRPMWFPDGQSILQAARGNQNTTCFYKVDLKTGEVRQLLNIGSGAPPNTALSPDGKTVYAELIDSKTKTTGLVAFDLATGDRRNIYSGAAIMRGVAASPDGGMVAFIAETGIGKNVESHLYTARPDGSDLHDLFTVDPPDALPTTLAWSPNSHTIYFVRGDPSIGRPHESQMWRISANGGTSQSIFSARNIGYLDISRDGTRLVYGGGELAQTEYWALDNLERSWKASSK